jgi:glycosyltransferase involved in cell wall biosynthesis
MNKVSIIIPYNKDRGFLSEAIESATGQGEIILSKSDGSVGRNVNYGISLVKTPYFCILAEDDILPPDAIKNRLDAIGSFDWIHSQGEAFTPDGHVHGFNWHNPNPTLKGMLRFNQIIGSTTLYRTDLGRLFPWDESLITAEEYDFHLRLMYQGINPGYTDKITFRYRRHTEQKSLGVNADQKKRQEVVELIRKRYETLQ